MRIKVCPIRHVFIWHSVMLPAALFCRYIFFYYMDRCRFMDFPLISSTFIGSPPLKIDWRLRASFSLGMTLTKKVDLYPHFLYQSFCFCSFSFLRLPIFQNLLVYSGIVPEISLFRLPWNLIFDFQ